MCAKLEIANAKTIRYSDPKGAHGERQEGSRATYTCMPGFAKAGNKASRVCKSGKFDGAQQLCVGELCVWRKSGGEQSVLGHPRCFHVRCVRE